MTEKDTALQALTKGAGYYSLENLVEPELAAKVRDFVLARLDEGVENSSGDINLTHLLTLDPMFQAMITNPRLLAIAHALIGNDCKLAAFTAKTLMPGCSSGHLHVDYPYWAMDPGMPVEPALMMQVIWMMQPFTEENGGTWIAPGSQHYDERVDEERFRQEAIQVTGNAGDAVISHGLLWHQTAINHSEEPRVALLINFSQLAIRPMRELGPFTDEFLNNASPSLKALLPIDYGRSLNRRVTGNA